MCRRLRSHHSRTGEVEPVRILFSTLIMHAKASYRGTAGLDAMCTGYEADYPTRVTRDARDQACLKMRERTDSLKNEGIL